MRSGQITGGDITVAKTLSGVGGILAANTLKTEQEAVIGSGFELWANNWTALKVTSL